MTGAPRTRFFSILARLAAAILLASAAGLFARGEAAREIGDFRAPAAAELPAAEEIVARHIEARGGRAALENIRSVIYRGLYSEGGSAAHDAAMALRRPFYKLVGDPERLSNEFREGYDGSPWEFYGDPGIVVRTVGAAAAASRHGVAIDGPLADYVRKGTSVTVEGIETVAGRKSYRLLVRMRDGYEQVELVDAETGMLTAERKAAPIHAFGKTIASETRFGDYKPVEGVMFSHSNREVEIGTGRTLNEMKWTSITVNRELDVSVFSPPAFARTPLQQLLEQLFEERGDVEGVLWSYRDFRRAHPETDTDRGIQAIGYQILKMGDPAAAAALLKANAADYPRSSGAAFALGRALRTAGRLSEARVEFRRAIDLDPANQRARAALDETRN